MQMIQGTLIPPPPPRSNQVGLKWLYCKCSTTFLWAWWINHSAYCLWRIPLSDLCFYFCAFEKIKASLSEKTGCRVTNNGCVLDLSSNNNTSSHQTGWKGKQNLYLVNEVGGFFFLLLHLRGLICSNKEHYSKFLVIFLFLLTANNQENFNIYISISVKILISFEFDLQSKYIFRFLLKLKPFAHLKTFLIIKLNKSRAFISIIIV